MLCLQVTKVPLEVQKERAEEARRANEATKRGAQRKNNEKTRMKGKNAATKRHRKRQDNIIEVRQATALFHALLLAPCSSVDCGLKP